MIVDNIIMILKRPEMGRFSLINTRLFYFHFPDVQTCEIHKFMLDHRRELLYFMRVSKTRITQVCCVHF
jgi:hypothetical protein